MGFSSIRNGYYLIPIADLETLFSLNNLSSKNRVTTLNVVIRRIDENKRWVNLKTTRTTGETETVQHELNFLGDDLDRVTECSFCGLKFNAD